MKMVDPPKTEVLDDDKRLDILSRYSVLDTPRIAIEAAGLGTWIIDLETKAFIPCPRMKELFGFHLDEEMSYEALVGQISDKYRKKVTDAINATINNRGQFSMEFPVLGFRDQKLRWINVLGAINADATTNLSCFVGVIIDITEQKEEQKRRSKLIGMVSHELRTPLTTLKAYVQMLQGWAKKRKDSFTMSTLVKVERQVRKMGTMIAGFLNVSQIDSGKIQVDLQEFDVDEVIKEAIEETSLINPTHTITFSPCENITIKADRDKIEQVVINLLSNAVKYSPREKAIEISCKLIDNNVQVCVTDKGMGIKQKDVKKLFKRYYRVQSEPMKRIPGFGIGLYLCAEIIKYHKGNIWVQSEEGKGSEFYFTLPVQIT
jgi:PAS domain S-box-containing protein